MSFRNCCFEYAGVYSGKYNLRLCYVKNQTYDFDSGGDFDLKTDQIPRHHEQLYYGKDYSAKPLQFEVEIINPDDYISESQMLKIKNWLFGQDGWKKFKVNDGKGERSLRCILIPIADITEGNHYKGLRFSLRNASPFWYGEEKTIVLNNETIKQNPWWNENSIWDRWCVFQIDIPNNGYVDDPIYPTIEIKPRRNVNRGSASQDGAWEVGTYFALSNTSAKTITEGNAKNGLNYKIEEDSRVSCDLEYMKTSKIVSYTYTESDGIYSISIDDNILCTVMTDDDEYKIFVDGSNVGSKNVSDYINISEPYCKPVVAALNYMGYRVKSAEDESGEAVYAIDNVNIDTRYGEIQSETYPDLYIPIIINEDLPKPMLKLHYGTNICRIYFGHIYDSITIKYTPMLRMGAF